MISSELLFERLPANDLKVEAYSVSSASDAANNNSARYFAATRHSNCKEAIDHLLRQIAAGKRRIGISGHGIDGYVETGAGAHGSYDFKQWIRRSNQSVWSPDIGRLFQQNFDDFFIYSCSTGAGVPGAYLLWLLARHMEKSVYARTGLLYIVTQGKKVWLETEAGATWQKATGDMLSPPDPIESPSKHLAFRNKSSGFEYIKDGSIIFVPFAEIEKIEIITTEDRSILVARENVAAFCRELLASEAIERPGQIMASVTARLSLFTETEIFPIEIYGDRVAKIEGIDVIYFIGNFLRSMLDGLTED